VKDWIDEGSSLQTPGKSPMCGTVAYPIFHTPFLLTTVHIPDIPAHNGENS